MRRLLIFAFPLLLASLCSAQQMWVIATVAGGGPNNLPATGAAIGSVGGVAVDGAGNLYVTTEFSSNAILEVTGGQVFRVAGAGTGAGDALIGIGGPATEMTLWDLGTVAVDGAGDIFIPEDPNYIYKVDPNGIITVVAGDGQGINYLGQCVFDGDGPALQHSLCQPVQVVVDGQGNLFVSDFGSYRIRKIDTQGNMTTVAGDGPNVYGKCVFDGDGPATNHSVCPGGIALDSSGNLYIADFVAYTVRKVDTSGNMTTVAGNGSSSYSGDGGPALSAGMIPGSVALDTAGNIYIADENYRIRKVDTSGIITTVAGNRTYNCTSDEAGPALQQSICGDWIAVDKAGNLYVDGEEGSTGAQAKVAYKIDTRGNMAPFAGNGQDIGVAPGVPATQELETMPVSIFADPSGVLYFFAYYYLADNGVVKMGSDGTLSWVVQGLSGTAYAIDGVGNVYSTNGPNLANATEVLKW